MSDAELIQMLRSSASRVVNYAGDRIDALTAKVAELEACLERQGSGHREDLDEIANVSVERLRRAKAAEAERDRLREERDAILSDSTIHSDQREKYERLCARIAAGKASQQDAVDAIRQLCRDNERLALRRSDDRAALKGESHE